MKLLQSFLDNKSFESAETSLDYSKVITRFIEHFDENLETLSTEEMNEYLYGEFSMYSYSKDGTLHYRKYAVSTFEKNINIIRSFLNYLFESALIDYNFAADIKATEQERSITKGDLPEVGEIDKIVAYLEKQVELNKDYTSLRNLALFNLVFHSGISTNELSSVNMNDLSVVGKTYQLTVHRPVMRQVQINQSDAALITDLIKFRQFFGPEDNALFISLKNKKRLPRRSIGYLINKFCEDASIPLYSAETFSKAGMLAALSIGYDVSKLAEDLNVSEEYLKRRVRYSGLSNKVSSYSELFERRHK